MDEQPKKRGFLEKFSVILQSSGGLLTAVTVAIIGFIGTNYMKDREMRESKNSIYTQLTINREDAESSLRKDMFVSIIQPLLNSDSTGLDERVLNLELLAYNFHESLNLKPLFTYLERKVNASNEPNKDDYLKRLYKVATEINRKQMLVLEFAGSKADMIIDLENLKQNPGGFPLGETTLTAEGITRQVSLFVLAADTTAKQINMRMEIKTPDAKTGKVDTNTAVFWVGYFDFPMIDNTRLPNDQRAAIVLNAFEDGFADITLALFPGSYASLKDKASLQDIINNMTKTGDNN